MEVKILRPKIATPSPQTTSTGTTTSSHRTTPQKKDVENPYASPSADLKVTATGRGITFGKVSASHGLLWIKDLPTTETNYS